MDHLTNEAFNRRLDQLKADIAEMFTEQTRTLLEHIDVAKRELKHDLSDLRGNMLEEMRRRIDQHIVAHHE